MQPVLAIALTAMHQDMARLDRVALNLANVATPGYKREVIAARPFVDALDDAAAARATDASPDAGQMLVRLDRRPGTLKKTGEPFDVALTGEGYFEVATAAGPAYTRQGNFKTDAQGRLVTTQGDPVMGKNGEIYLTTLTPLIDALGTITEPYASTGASAAAPGTPVAQLKIVQLDAAQTAPLGNGLVAANAGAAVLADADIHLRQGALENANVETLQEMVQLMQTLRHFESMQKIAQGYDDMVGTAVRKLGDLS
jgi:flagellar basal-body rod protein FlgF